MCCQFENPLPCHQCPFRVPVSFQRWHRGITVEEEIKMKKRQCYKSLVWFKRRLLNGATHHPMHNRQEIAWYSICGRVIIDERRVHSSKFSLV